jgi:hypothetical protein
MTNKIPHCKNTCTTIVVIGKTHQSFIKKSLFYDGTYFLEGIKDKKGISKKAYQDVRYCIGIKLSPYLL